MSMSKIPVCDYEGSDYQQRFWERADREYEDGAEAAALRRLLPAGGERMLELGAGAGRNSLRYSGFRTITLLDYSLSQLQQAKVRLGDEGGYNYVVADVYYLPFASGAFEAATMIRTLHHMAEPQAALSSVRRVLKPGASLILEYANKRNLKAIARWLGRRQTWSPFDGEPVEFTELNFNFHPKTVRRWLARADFVVRRQLAVSHFRLAILKRLLPTSALIRADSALQPMGDWIQIAPSVFVSAEARDDQDSR